MYLVALAGDEEADAIVLPAELEVEGFLELAERGVLVARDGDGGGLVLGGLGLDLVLEGIIVDVVDAPLRYGLLLKSLAEFHLVTSIAGAVAALAAPAYQSGRTSAGRGPESPTLCLFVCSCGSCACVPVCPCACVLVYWST